MNKVKNCYSAPGMGYSLHGTYHIHLRDCPSCKYGTLDMGEFKIKGFKDNVKLWICDDCQAEFTEDLTPFIDPSKVSKVSKTWCAMCGKWGNHSSGSCKDS